MSHQYVKIYVGDKVYKLERCYLVLNKDAFFDEAGYVTHEPYTRLERLIRYFLPSYHQHVSHTVLPLDYPFPCGITVVNDPHIAPTFDTWGEEYRYEL